MLKVDDREDVSRTADYEEKRQKIKCCSAETITDLCNSGDIPEVELVSLIEEKIPCYKLRADTLTSFSGYENEDWFVKTPVIPAETDLDLSPEIVAETLKYFVLCADRLSQMTKTYNDIDAVTRLLEEKERDLELAARIGQSLLDKNKDLQHKNESLEQELATTNETVTQLRHDLQLKSGLLQIYTQDVDTDSEAGTPVGERGLAVRLDVFNKKIQSLEEENVKLRNEASFQFDEIATEERKEIELVNDCVKQLSEANIHVSVLQEEFAQKCEDNIRQQEEITHLLSQVVDLQKKNRELNQENAELQASLDLAKECQNELSQELIDVKEKYAEIHDALQELQEATKDARRSRLPSATRYMYGMYAPYADPNSLASELESSLGRESDGYSSDDKMSNTRRVFDTVKYARNRPRRSTRQGCFTSCPTTVVSSTYAKSPSFSAFDSQTSDNESLSIDSYQTDDDSLYSSMSSMSRRGCAAGSELDGEQNLQSSGIGTITDDLGSENGDTTACQTPDFLQSLGLGLRRKSSGQKHFHMPEKLKIIKPLEGSVTLLQWQKLATPHLGRLFEPRPGIQVKGEKKLDGIEEVYNLYDFEEDEDSNPGKSFMGTSSVFTYTTSTVLHPSDQTQVTPSYSCAQLSTQMVTQPPSIACSTKQEPSIYDTPYLAKILNKKGIHGVLPSSTSENEPASPTPTPPPSPVSSRPASPLPSTCSLNLPTIVSLPIEFTSTLSREQKARNRSAAGLNKLGILRQVHTIGLENVISPTCETTEPSLEMRTIPDEEPLTLKSNEQPKKPVKTGLPSVINRCQRNMLGQNLPRLPPLGASTNDSIGTLRTLRKGGYI